MEDLAALATRAGRIGPGRNSLHELGEIVAQLALCVQLIYRRVGDLETRINHVDHEADDFRDGAGSGAVHAADDIGEDVRARANSVAEPGVDGCPAGDAAGAEIGLTCDPRPDNVGAAAGKQEEEDEIDAQKKKAASVASSAAQKARRRARKEAARQTARELEEAANLAKSLSEAVQTVLEVLAPLNAAHLAARS